MATTVQVKLGERSYDILVGAGLLKELGLRSAECVKGRRALIVSDTHVDPLYGEACQQSLVAAEFKVARVVIPAGEEAKSGQRLFRLYEAAVTSGMDRTSIVIALGGGVVGDLAGFAAATYLRGVDFIQVPTSLLAMVDSSVGGKTGINLSQGKNLVGSFHQPRLVVADTSLLKSLPRREFVSGLAEVIKHGVIRDAALFALLESQMPNILAMDEGLMEKLVAWNCTIKASVVSEDERDVGLRAVLNFGHTVGHAVETALGYGAWLHGEAIAVGMVFAARLSEKMLGFQAADSDRLIQVLSCAGLPIARPALPWSDVRKVMETDKKGACGKPKLVLAKNIGQVEFGCEVTEDLMADIWKAMPLLKG